MLHLRGSCFSRLAVVGAVPVVVVCLLMTSCETTAQRQGSGMSQAIQVAGQKWNACIEKVGSNPTYKVVVAYMSSHADRPTLRQLQNKNIPSDGAIQDIIAYQNEISKCRAQWIEDNMQIAPGVVPIFTEYYYKSDL
jgi:hypothetical protein